jgi:hypothetical protein
LMTIRDKHDCAFSYRRFGLSDGLSAPKRRCSTFIAALP